MQVIHLKVQHSCTSNGLKLVLALCTCTCTLRVSAGEIAQSKYKTEEGAGNQTGPRNYVSVHARVCVTVFLLIFVFF